MKRHIPNFLTSANLSCGVLAILMGDLYWGPILIVLGGVFDVFDGMIARMLGVSGELGLQLDSLADMVTFGVAPAYLFYHLYPSPHTLVTIGAILLVVGGAYRLATFNTLPPSKYFKGLPIPASGLFFAGLVFGYHHNEELIVKLLQSPYAYIILGALFAFLMNSSITMFSAKSIDKNSFSNNVPHILLVLIAIVLLIINPYLALPITILSYFVLSIVGSRRRRA